MRGCGILLTSACGFLLSRVRVQPPPAAARPKLKWEPNDLPFQSKTTAGEAFVPGPIEPRQPYRPENKTKTGCVDEGDAAVCVLCVFVVGCMFIARGCCCCTFLCSVRCRSKARRRTRLVSRVSGRNQFDQCREMQRRCRTRSSLARRSSRRRTRSTR